MVRQLSDSFALPVIGICDWNPHGLELLVYAGVAVLTEGLTD
jgi:hypothetical protein